MLKRILKSKLPIIAYNPIKTFCLKYSKALFNAGALPVLDTEFMKRDEAVNYIKDLSLSDILFGVRVDVKTGS